MAGESDLNVDEIIAALLEGNDNVWAFCIEFSEGISNWYNSKSERGGY